MRRHCNVFVLRGRCWQSAKLADSNVNRPRGDVGANFISTAPIAPLSPKGLTHEDAAGLTGF